MAHLSPVPKFRATDDNGEPLVAGKLYSYAAGTSTPQATYVDQTEIAPNTNPIILNANGEANIWLKDSLSYKLVLKDASDVTVWTADNIAHINDLSITTSKLADGVLSSTSTGRLKMADGFLSADSAGRAKMADGFATASKLAVNSVETAKLVDLSVTSAKLAVDAVETAKIKDLAVTGAKFADASITSSKLSWSPTILGIGFSASGTWTVPAGVNFIFVDAIGGGGGGGNGNPPAFSGAGGNGGNSGYMLTNAYLAVVPGETLTITIGAGGTPGSGTGGNTVITGINGSLYAWGGLGGLGTYAATPAALRSPEMLTGLTASIGGQGGAISGGVSGFPGAAGSNSLRAAGQSGMPATGAIAGGGGGGAGWSVASSNPAGNDGANAPANSGSGGQGGSTAQYGGAGGSGRLALFYVPLN